MNSKRSGKRILMKRQLIKPGLSCRYLVGLAIFFSCAGLHAAEKPNVLFIAVDDLNDWVGVLEGYPQMGM